MEDFNNNYIPWQFDRSCSEKQKLRRWKDLRKYILQLWRKIYCAELSKFMYKKIVDKYCKLMGEFNDLFWELEMDESEMDKFGDEIEEIKESFGWCISCFDGTPPDCSCVLCENCWRIPELCFCNEED